MIENILLDLTRVIWGIHLTPVNTTCYGRGLHRQGQGSRRPPPQGMARLLL